MVYLEDRAKNARASTKSTKPVSASWLSVLFAVLAVGSQYHDSSYHVRTRDSQKYIQITFHFLRLGNFLLRYSASRCGHATPDPPLTAPDPILTPSKRC